MFYCFICFVVFFFKQKTAYKVRISDWSSDVCSSDLRFLRQVLRLHARRGAALRDGQWRRGDDDRQRREDGRDQGGPPGGSAACRWRSARGLLGLAESGSPDADHEERRNLQEQQRCGAEPRGCLNIERRSEEHTSELQSLMRTSYAVFCLKKKNKQNRI